MIKKRKLLSLVLSLVMVLTGFTLPTQTNANENTIVEQGSDSRSKKEIVSLAKKVMETDDYVKGDLLVVLKPEYSSKQAEFKTTDFPEVKTVKVENLTYCNNPDSELISEDFRTILLITMKHKKNYDMLQAIDRLMSREDVESVSLNSESQIQSTQTVPPSDSQYDSQWALKKIDALGAWSKTTGNTEVQVGIIDSGIEYTHDELAPNMWNNPGEIPGDGIDNDGNGYIDDVYGWDFWNDNSNPMDIGGHGTMCAGVVAADLNNKDVSGIAPRIKLVALKVGNEGFMISAAVKAILYAANMGIDVVNYSSGLTSRDLAFEAAIDNYEGIFVGAAGNYGRNNDVTPYYPRTTEHSNVIKVASTTTDDSLSNFSNYGIVEVTLAAPGSYILSTALNNTYEPASGTSFAAPYVAGVAALIKSQYPELSAKQVIDSIKEGVDILPSLSGKVETGGRLNANKAMEAARFQNNAVPMRSAMKVYDLADLNAAMAKITCKNIYIMRDIQLQSSIRLTRSINFYGGSKLIGNGRRHFIIDTTNNVKIALGGIILENGGIHNDSTGFELSGSGAVIQNSDWTDGGAIYNQGSMTVKGIRVENCNAINGGGICNTGYMSMMNTTIFNNQASYGGAIYTNDILEISGGIFKNNTSKSDGGGIYGNPDSCVYVSDTPQITYNTAMYLGGGVYTSGTFKTETSDGLRVDYNSAQNGGGIYAQSGADIHLEGKSPGGPNISVSSNKSSVNGGGVYVNNSASLYLGTSFVCANTALGTGGGMFIKGNYTQGSMVQLIANSPNSIIYQYDIKN